MVPNALIIVTGPWDLQIDDCCPINVRRLQYNDRIAITVSDKSKVKWPFVMNLGLYIRLDSSPNKMPALFDFVLEFLMNDNKIGGIEGVANSFSDTWSAIPMKIPQFPLTGEGVLKFQFKAKLKSGEELYSFSKSIKITLVEQAKDLVKH